MSALSHTFYSFKNGALHTINRWRFYAFAAFFVVSVLFAAPSHAQSQTPLEKHIGLETYNYLRSQNYLSEEAWSYLELIALRVSIYDRLTQKGEFLAPWDQVYVAQNEIINILTTITPLAKEAQDLEEIINDGSDRELTEIAKEEIVATEEALHTEFSRMVDHLWNIAQPKVSNDVIIEVTPTQSTKSSLAIGSLTQFYINLASLYGWKVEILSQKEETTSQKPIVDGASHLSHAHIRIKGRGAYRTLFLESGVHRFIYTDQNLGLGSSSKTHTNYADVKVYATPTAKSFVFKESDVKLEFTRSSGAGGQHVNTTDSAVRATHEPTGTTVFVQKERSQHQNRRVALELLKAMVFTKHLEKNKQRAERVRNRAQALSAELDTSPYARTYNLLREPRQTMALLNGYIKLDSHVNWSGYLDSQLEVQIDSMMSEIQRLLTKLTDRETEEYSLFLSDVQAQSMNISTPSSMSPGFCRSILSY